MGGGVLVRYRGQRQASALLLCPGGSGQAPPSVEELLIVPLSLEASDSLSSKAADHVALLSPCACHRPGLWGC